jgi:predicted membrane-bound spermidine synthase
LGSSRRTLAAATACFFLSGAAGLLYEVAWTRLLGVLFGHTVHAITTVLVVFMGGLALGGLLAGRRSDRAARPLRAYAALEAGTAAYCALTPLLLSVADPAYVSVWRALQPSLLAGAAIQAAFAAAVLAPATVLMGATLPVLARGATAWSGAVGSSVGRLYAVNTAGAVLGTAAAGFVLLPGIGVRATIALAVGMNLAAAALAWALDRATPPLEPGAGEPASPGADAGAGEPLADAALVMVLVSTAVAGAGAMAYEIAWTRALGLVLGSSTYAFSAMLTTFLVGLASGVTAGALAQHPLDAIDVAELEPAMREASGFFEAENHGVLRDPRVRLVIGDGRHVLAAAAAPYDLVVSEPSNPWIAGVASLFTVDFYRLVRSRLAPGGLMVQWLQAYDLVPRDLRMVVRSFREVFPDATL